MEAGEASAVADRSNVPYVNSPPPPVSPSGQQRPSTIISKLRRTLSFKRLGNTGRPDAVGEASAPSSLSAPSSGADKKRGKSVRRASSMNLKSASAAPPSDKRSPSVRWHVGETIIGGKTAAGSSSVAGGSSRSAGAGPRGTRASMDAEIGADAIRHLSIADETSTANGAFGMAADATRRRMSLPAVAPNHRPARPPHDSRSGRSGMDRTKGAGQGYGRIESYKRLGKLGEGTYAVVYQGISLITGVVVALKDIKLEREEGYPCTALREVTLLKELKHANIVTLHDIIPAVSTLTLVFEYVPRDLKQYMDQSNGFMDLHNVMLFTFQVRAAAGAHAQSIVDASARACDPPDAHPTGPVRTPRPPALVAMRTARMMMVTRVARTRRRCSEGSPTATVRRCCIAI